MATDISRKLADYGLAFDLISNITAVKSEKEAIDSIFEVFDAICAPARSFYLPFRGSETGDIYVNPPGTVCDETVKDSMTTYDGEQLWKEEKAGFIFRVMHNEETLGVFQLEEVPFPQYKEHYLSLASNINSVLGLAISNARVYQNLESLVEERTEELANTNKSLVKEIKERKKTEVLLVKAKEHAENATKLKDKFVSFVSHDLKSPLTVVQGFLKMIRLEVFALSSDRVKAMIDAAIKSSDEMMALIENLLSISRLKTGVLTPQYEFLSLALIGSRTVADFKSLADGKGIDLRLEITDGGRIYADETLFTQAVQNIVANAIKFCGAGDTITICTPPEEQATLCVKDTGPGIGEDVIEKVFQYGSNVSTTGTAGETGTGLGLPYTKEIMEAHNGSVTIESKMGQGSLFSLKVPHVRPKILVVDDNSSFRMVQKQFMSYLGVDIVEAVNGKEALELIENMEFHLLITDIEMPEMDGLELLKTIKASIKTKSLPVIVITGKYGMEIREKVFQLGADDFLTKPLDNEDFIPRVRRFIS